MARRADNWSEVETLLSAGDSARSRRRRPHHLPPDYYRSQALVFCVTLCARQHGQPFASPELADRIVDAVRFYRERRLWMVYAYCLMPDHLHAVVRLGEAVPEAQPRKDEPGDPPLNLMQVVERFREYTTREIAWKHGLSGRLWQCDFYDHVTRGARDFDQQCQYVLDNPVRKGLVERREDYPWLGSADE